MSMVNDDVNWRLIAAEALPENSVITISSAGKAELDDGTAAVGICPQPVASGATAPVMRHGKIGGLVGLSAGTKLYAQADGTLGTVNGPSGPILAVVDAKDTSCAFILTGNLDAL